MQNGFDGERFHKLLEEARKKMEIQIFNLVYAEGVRAGRDLEFRTAQDHEKGMKDLASDYRKHGKQMMKLTDEIDKGEGDE